MHISMFKSASDQAILALIEKTYGIDPAKLTLPPGEGTLVMEVEHERICMRATQHHFPRCICEPHPRITLHRGLESAPTVAARIAQREQDLPKMDLSDAEETVILQRMARLLARITQAFHGLEADDGHMETLFVPASTAAGIEAGSMNFVQIAHDDDCARLHDAAAPCSCDPDITPFGRDAERFAQSVQRSRQQRRKAERDAAKALARAARRGGAQ